MAKAVAGAPPGGTVAGVPQDGTSCKWRGVARAATPIIPGASSPLGALMDSHAPSAYNVNVGVLGHVDSGKTSLGGQRT